MEKAEPDFLLIYTLWNGESRTNDKGLGEKARRFQEIRIVPSEIISIFWPDLNRGSSGGETATMGIGF